MMTSLRQLLALSVSATMAAACADENSMPPDPSDNLRYPMALLADPTRPIVYAVGGNFDRANRAGMLRAIDTRTDKFLAVRTEVPSFAGEMALQLGNAATELGQRLFVTARDDDSLTMIDLGAAATPALQCGADPGTGKCDDGHHASAFGGQPLGDDPLAVELTPGPDGRTRVWVATATDGHASLYDFDPKLPGPPSLRPLGFLNLASGLDAVRTVPTLHRTFVASSRLPAIFVLRVDPNPLNPDAPFLPVQEAGVGMPSGSVRDYGRDLMVSRDQAKLYVAWRSPNSLLVVDISPNELDRPRMVVQDIIPLGQSPSQMVLAPTTPDGRDLLYISCFGEDSIWVVDPKLRSVVDIIHMSVRVYSADGSLSRIFKGGAYSLGLANTDSGYKLYAGLFAVAPNDGDAGFQIAVVPLSPGMPGRHIASGVVGIAEVAK